MTKRTIKEVEQEMSLLKKEQEHRIEILKAIYKDDKRISTLAKKLTK